MSNPYGCPANILAAMADDSVGMLSVIRRLDGRRATFNEIIAAGVLLS